MQEALAADESAYSIAKRTNVMLAGEFGDILRLTEWPPNSPDVCPLDFSSFGQISAKIPDCADLASLRSAIVKAASDLQNIADLVTLSFPRRVALMIEQAGGHFEQLRRRKRGVKAAAVEADGSETDGVEVAETEAEADESEAEPQEAMAIDALLASDDEEDLEERLFGATDEERNRAPREGGPLPRRFWGWP